MLASLLVVSAVATTPEPPPMHHVRRVRAPVIAASFAGALVGGAASIGVGLLAEDGVVWAATLPVFVLAGAAIPTALMTDGRAGYVTLGSGVGMAGGWLLGVFAGSALGALAPGDGGAVLVGAGVGATVLGTLGAATGALLAAHLDIKGQEKTGWTLIPTYLPQGHAPGLVFSGRY